MSYIYLCSDLSLNLHDLWNLTYWTVFVFILDQRKFSNAELLMQSVSHMYIRKA